MRMTGDPKPFDITISDPVQRIQAFIDRYDASYTGFEAALMRNIRIVSAESASSEGSKEAFLARAVFELEVVHELSNPMGNMHGGAVALVADMATSMAAAPASQKGFWEFGGVSRTLTVNYLGPMSTGSTVVIDCRLVNAGKRLSLLRCEFRDKISGNLLAIAEHGKVAAGVQTRGEEGAKGSRL